MQEELKEVEKNTEKNVGISREMMYNHFIDNIKKDLSKCVLFAATFVSPNDIVEFVQDTLKPFQLNNE